MKYWLAIVVSLFVVIECTTPSLGKEDLEKSKNHIPIRSNIKLPKVDEIKKFAWYAAASVCNDTLLETWSCTSCKKVPSGTTEFVGSIENKAKGTRAYLAVLNETKQIVVAFRGGVNLDNALQFLGILQVKFKPYINDNKVTVHLGIKSAMESLIEDLIVKLKMLFNTKQYNDYKLVVAGHSLGGGMASLALIRIQYELKLNWSRLSLYTYGQFRTGNVHFAKYYDHLPITVSRGVNYNDLGPHIFKVGFINPSAHIQTEFWIDNVEGTSYKLCDNKFIEDTNCSSMLKGSERTIEAHLNFFQTSFDQNLAC